MELTVLNGLLALVGLLATVWFLYELVKASKASTPLPAPGPALRLQTRDQRKETADSLARRACDLTDDLTVLAAELRAFSVTRDEHIHHQQREIFRLEDRLVDAQQDAAGFESLYRLFRRFHELRLLKGCAPHGSSRRSTRPAPPYYVYEKTPRGR